MDLHGVFFIECKGFHRDRRYIEVPATPYLAAPLKTIRSLTCEIIAKLGCVVTPDAMLLMHDRTWWRAPPDEPVLGTITAQSKLLLVSDASFAPRP